MPAVALVRSHEAALDRVLRSLCSTNRLPSKLKAGALQTGIATGLSLPESRKYLAGAIRCTRR